MDCGVPLVVMAIPAADTSLATSAIPVIRRVNDAFSPTFIVVPVGCTVHVVNDDDICHSFFSSSGKNAFELGLQKPGESSSMRFEAPGPVQVYCKLHAGKQATLLVAPTAHFGVVNSTGQFEIDNFDPGDYVLETWTEGRALQRVEVTVPPRRTKFVEIPVDERQLRAPE
jgi:plastocyanin